MCTCTVTAEEAKLLCQRDPRYVPLVEHFGLLTHEGYKDGYSGLVLTVMGQQLSDRVVKKLQQNLDPEILISPEALLAACTYTLQFRQQQQELQAQQKQEEQRAVATATAAVSAALESPAPTAIAGRALLPFSRQKLATLQQIAQLFVSQELSFAQLQQMDKEQREQVLLSIRGIGLWSVSMMELMVFGEPDYLAVHDYGVQQGWAYLTGVDLHSMTAAERLRQLQAHARAISPVGSTANWYLWALKGVKGKLAMQASAAGQAGK